MNDLVYLDVETTGLDPELHEVWEIAYAVNDGPILSSFVDHTLLGADPVALTVGQYHNRKAQASKGIRGWTWDS